MRPGPESPSLAAELLRMMVHATGIEPVTPAMSRRCSTAELRVPHSSGSLNLTTPQKPLSTIDRPLRCQQRAPTINSLRISPTTPRIVSIRSLSPVHNHPPRFTEPESTTWASSTTKSLRNPPQLHRLCIRHITPDPSFSARNVQFSACIETILRVYLLLHSLWRFRCSPGPDRIVQFASALGCAPIAAPKC